MSSFFKGIFGGKESEHGQANGELPPPQMDALQGEETEDLGELKAAIEGTAETDRDPLMMVSGTLGSDSDERPEKQVEASTPAPTSARSGRGKDQGDRFLDGAPQPPVNDEFSAERVWHDSGVGHLEQATVEKAQHLLSSLPDSTPDDVKRQIVEASLVAFEVSLADITAGAESEIAALRRYIDDRNADAEGFRARSEERISELESEIQRIRGTIAEAENDRERLVGAATEVIEQVQPILDFFSPGAKPKPADLPRPKQPPAATGANAGD